MSDTATLYLVNPWLQEKKIDSICFVTVVFPVQGATQGGNFQTSGRPSSNIALWDGDCPL